MKPDASIITAKEAIVRVAYEGMVSYAWWEEGALIEFIGSPFANGEPGPRELDPEKAILLAPCEPSKVVAVGRNYLDHIKEFSGEVPDEPMIFLKPSTSVIGPGAAIRRLPNGNRVDHEAELAVVMGAACSGVTPEEALDYVLGYTCLNDVSDRILQKKDIQFGRAKGYDTFCPLGPAIALGLDPEDLQVMARVNGELKQNASTKQMIFSLAQLISFASQVMTLLPGDVIATGTPSGVSPLTAGDTVEIEIEGIGILSNPVQEA